MTKQAGERYTVAVDFDGVLHLYLSPWVNEHTIPDGPVPGAMEWLRAMLEGGLDVVIFTTRGRSAAGRDAVHQWIAHHWPEAPLTRLQVTAVKPPALVYLDDRAMRFEGPGSWPTVDDIHQAKPWNKRKVRAEAAQVSKWALSKAKEDKWAAIQHDIWSHWMRWFFENDTPENRERWKRQMATPFSELSEREKQSDRNVVNEFVVPSLAALLDSVRGEPRLQLVAGLLREGRSR